MKYLVSLLSLFLTSIIGCSVAPALESPRIKSGVKFEMDASTMQNEMRWHLSDTVRRGRYTDELKIHFSESLMEFAPKLKFAFSNKVEFGGYVWWLLLNSGWDQRIKINILERGEPKMFRNIGLALLAGAKGAWGEWNKSNRNWAGITVGTLHAIGEVEYEYIVMPTIGINHFKSLDDGLGTGGVTFADIIINTGVTLSSLQGLYASFAILLSAYDFDINYYRQSNQWNQAQINEIDFIPNKMGFNFFLGWKFGGKKDF